MRLVKTRECFHFTMALKKTEMLPPEPILTVNLSAKTF